VREEKTDKNVLRAEYACHFFLLFIYSYVHTLGHFSPLPPIPSLSLPPPSIPGRTCSALFSNFVDEKT
jgi:hypothetical protein